MTRDLIMIAVFGAAGAVCRYGVSGWIQTRASDFPYGTLTVNVAGCFLLGALMHVGLSTTLVPPIWRTALAIGFLGGMTTFSTFSYETICLLEEGNWGSAAGNVALSVGLGLTAVWAGLAAARAITGGA
ncbi:MAG: fluoride efflux transporter CrcB [Longimicrobiales bacterium]